MEYTPKSEFHLTIDSADEKHINRKSDGKLMHLCEVKARFLIQIWSSQDSAMVDRENRVKVSKFTKTAEEAAVLAQTLVSGSTITIRAYPNARGWEWNGKIYSEVVLEGAEFDMDTLQAPLPLDEEFPAVEADSLDDVFSL